MEDARESVSPVLYDGGSKRITSSPSPAGSMAPRSIQSALNRAMSAPAVPASCEMPDAPSVPDAALSGLPFYGYHTAVRYCKNMQS